MLIIVAVFLVYHFTVHKITNRRPLGGPNVNVTQGVNATENEASFAIDRARPQLLFGATNQLLTYTTGNGGRTWRSGASPVVHEPACARGEPHTAINGRREVMAFLVSPTCSDQLRSYLAVTSREVGTSRWGPAVRVAPATYRFGFDDAASLAFDARSGRLYLSWTRGLAAKLEATVVASSADGGQTWSSPVVVAKPADEPHLSTIAVAPNGDVYVGGIDAPHGIWIARSTDGGRSFGATRTAAPLRANPSDNCAGQSSFAPLPNEETSCLGPSPTVIATKNRVELVYDDAGANGTTDVHVAALDPTLRPLFRTQVNPPDTGKTQQLFPAATADSSTGTLWACWYDTTFDPHARRAWFTAPPPTTAEAGRRRSARQPSRPR